MKVRKDKKKIICILGMHRSGTSCLAGSLQSGGLYLGDVQEINPHNIKGNRENKQIQEFNDVIMAHNGGSWYLPPERVVWNAEHQTRLENIIAEYHHIDKWGFKDPRTLFTLDIWKTLIPDLEYVGTFRNPKLVVESLKKRMPGMLSDAEWFDLWKQHNEKMIEIWDKTPFPIINFDLDNENYLRSLNAIFKRLKLGKIKSVEGKSTILNNIFVFLKKKNKSANRGEIFFDATLRSGFSLSEDQIPAHILDVYKKLKEIAV